MNHIYRSNYFRKYQSLRQGGTVRTSSDGLSFAPTQGLTLLRGGLLWFKGDSRYRALDELDYPGETGNRVAGFDLIGSEIPDVGRFYKLGHTYVFQYWVGSPNLQSHFFPGKFDYPGVPLCNERPVFWKTPSVHSPRPAKGQWKQWEFSIQADEWMTGQPIGFRIADRATTGAFALGAVDLYESAL